MIKTEREREMVIGEDYEQEPLKFGECFGAPGWAFDGEIEIFKFRFDYFTLAKQYNALAEEKGWPTIDNPENLVMVWT
jgi:hypothetical protein